MKVRYFLVYVTSWLFCLLFQKCFEDVQENPIFCLYKRPSVLKTALFNIVFIINKVQSEGCDILLYLWEKWTSFSCCRDQIWNAVSINLPKHLFHLKSLFKLVADKFILSTIKKRETWSAKSLAFVAWPCQRLFI